VSLVVQKPVVGLSSALRSVLLCVLGDSVASGLMIDSCNS
jgi:hypothetical protein